MRRAAQRGLTAADLDDLVGALAGVQAMDTGQLRSLVLKTTGRPPSRQLSGDLLRRLLAHSLQEQALGGLDPKLTRTLDQLAGGGVAQRRLRLGAVLVREHGGATQQVMVVAGGYSWQDRVYPSLSAVAKAMTGTTWNGNRFFGLQATGEAKRSTTLRQEARSRRQGAADRLRADAMRASL